MLHCPAKMSRWPTSICLLSLGDESQTDFRLSIGGIGRQGQPVVTDGLVPVCSCSLSMSASLVRAVTVLESSCRAWRNRASAASRSPASSRALPHSANNFRVRGGLRAQAGLQLAQSLPEVGGRLDLGQPPIDLSFRCRECLGVIQNHRTLHADEWSSSSGASRSRLGRTALNPVIGHHHVDRVLGPPPGHVASARNRFDPVADGPGPKGWDGSSCNAGGNVEPHPALGASVWGSWQVVQVMVPRLSRKQLDWNSR